MCASVSIRFGPAGWSYADWNGPIYQRKEYALELLASVFDVIEVNSSFYRAPSPSHALGWLRKVAHNPAFQFTVKLWQGFTHARVFERSDVAAFRSGIEPLVAAGKLCALLVQFPWSFKYELATWEHLLRVASLFADLPLAVEVRHASWHRPSVLDELQQRHISLCSIDQPLFRDSLAATEDVTSPLGYIRLHGRNATDWFRDGATRDARYNYLYELHELRPWVERIRRIGTAAEQVVVITNNHFGGSAVVNALELEHMLRGQMRTVPARWLESFPRLAASCQRRLAAPGGRPAPVQGELFGTD